MVIYTKSTGALGGTVAVFATVLEQFYPGRRGREGLLRHLSKATQDWAQTT